MINSSPALLAGFLVIVIAPMLDLFIRLCYHRSFQVKSVLWWQWMVALGSTALSVQDETFFTFAPLFFLQGYGLFEFAMAESRGRAPNVCVISYSILIPLIVLIEVS